VKPAPFAYVRPETVDEALEALATGDAFALAGGQSLVPMLHMRLLRPATVVDINRLDELARITVGAAGVTIGALTRYSELEDSPLVSERLPLLQAVVSHIGDRQVRNRGTIGGSLAQADPVGELPLACLALGARVVLRNGSAERELTMDEFVLGPYTTAREPDELLVEVRFPEAPGACAFAEIGRRHNDFAVIAVAAVGDPASNGEWQNVRVAVAGADYQPRLFELGSSTLSDDALDAFADRCAAAADPPDDTRASAEYRSHLVRVHVGRVLRKLRDERQAPGA
jgi:carbon-monoxide dehydrogenase medium subunit